jgi:hypothetical protein
VQGMVQIYLPDIVTSNQGNVYLSITHIAYARFDTAFAVSPNNGLSYKIVLQDTARHLDEVLVIAKPIEKHGDTTSFNVSSFKTKTDESLEDLLKRMPGFSIDGSGNISYNGIPIEKILIEGDELSNNYKSISKNLTPEILSKIQLIEKYQNNPLLKDLIASNKQVINLVLKENAKLKPSGSLKLGLGIYDVYNADINVIGLKAKSKTLLLGSLNNIGKSQYDENGGNLQSFESNDTEIEAFRFQDAMTRQTTNQPSAFAIPNTSTLLSPRWHSNSARRSCSSKTTAPLKSIISTAKWAKFNHSVSKKSPCTFPKKKRPLMSRNLSGTTSVMSSMQAPVP